MSHENVEVCKRLFEAVARRDTEAALEYIHPQAELHSAIIGGAEGNAYHGHEGFRRWMAESDAAFEELGRWGPRSIATSGIASSASATSMPGGERAEWKSTRPSVGCSPCGAGRS